MSMRTNDNNIVRKFTDSIYYQVKLTEKCCKMLGKQIEEKLDLKISLDELTALGILNSYNGEMSQRDLAKMILKDRANTGKLLNVLEEKGYIYREEVTKNKRQAKVVTVTKSGQEIIEKTRQSVEPVFDEMSRKLSQDEYNCVRTILEKFREIVKETIEIHI